MLLILLVQLFFEKADCASVGALLFIVKVIQLEVDDARRYGAALIILAIKTAIRINNISCQKRS